MMLRPKIYQSEQQLIDIFESIDDGFFIMDKDYVITYANKAFEKHSSMKRRQVIGKTLWRSFPHVAYKDSLYKINYTKVIETRKPVTFNHFNTSKAWVQIKAFPTKEHGIAVFIRDITESMNAQKAIEASEHRFRLLTDMTTDIVFRTGADWKTLHRVDGGRFRNKLKTAPLAWIESLIPADKVKEMHKLRRQATKTKTPLLLEFPINRPNDGFTSWMYLRAVPILDDKGNITEWFGAVIDVTERRKQSAIRERMNLVTEQRNALIKLNKAKDEFVAIASHQLRTPATAVKQYMGMLLDGFAGTLQPNQQKLLQSAYDANERELLLINDLLKTAQIDGSSSNLKAEPTDIVALLTSVVDDHASLTEQRSQQIILNCTRTSLTLPIDATEIRLALANLIENASKYSHAGSTINVTLRLARNFVEIAIADQGVGVSTEHQQQIFEKFTRIRNDLTDVVHGTGLGLYWVKKIAEMHNGSITITSVPGEGSIFTMRLPRQARETGSRSTALRSDT